MDIRTDIINDVITSMQSQLDATQLQALKDTLYINLNNYEVQERCTALTTRNNSPQALLKRFIATKRVEGKSELTLERYADENGRLIAFLNKDLNEVTTYDLRFYLAMRKENSKRGMSNRTLDGIRRCIKSFFTFLYNEQLIERNPSAALAQIKYDKVIKREFSDTDLEKIKRSCKSPRDRALIEFLYSTGCRVSEIVRLNRSDIDFNKKSVIVFGKGSKEREVYLTEVASMYLEEYLNIRLDDEEALFIGRGSKRLHKSGIEMILKRLGQAANVENVHPHRYRRTLATNMLNRGAHIQDVATILGHEDLKTTQIYCRIDNNVVKADHKKYIL